MKMQMNGLNVEMRLEVSVKCGELHMVENHDSIKSERTYADVTDDYGKGIEISANAGVTAKADNFSGELNIREMFEGLEKIVGKEVQNKLKEQMTTTNNKNYLPAVVK